MNKEIDTSKSINPLRENLLSITSNENQESLPMVENKLAKKEPIIPSKFTYLKIMLSKNYILFKR